MAPEEAAQSAAVVPAIGTANSTAAVRSLGRFGVRPVVAAADPDRPACQSKYCREVVEVPDPVTDLAGYESALVSLAERSDVQTILPFREPDVYVLARNRDHLADHVGTPWPTLDTLRGAQDRVELFAIAERAGVATPETRLLDEWDDWDRPAVVKPRYTLHASEYDPAFTDSEVQQLSTQYVAPGEKPDREELLAEMGHVPLVQSYVPTTDEYGFFALYDEGDPVATFQHRQRRGWKYAGGPSAYREAIDDPALDSAGRRLLDELDWHGVAMVEFLRDPETGEYRLMEVNPRFWSSLPFTVQAGVDFPTLYWRQALDYRIERPPEYTPGVAGHLVTGELLHLHSILAEDYPLVERPSFLRTAATVAASLFTDRRFDYLDTSDPMPFLRDLQNTLGDVLAR